LLKGSDGRLERGVGGSLAIAQHLGDDEGIAIVILVGLDVEISETVDLERVEDLDRMAEPG